MKIQATLNGRDCVLEVSDEQIARLLPPQDLNQKDAAAFMRCDRKTFRKLSIPQNVNNRYSVALLQERANKIKA